MKRFFQLFAAASILIINTSAFAFTCVEAGVDRDICATWCNTDVVTYQIGELPLGVPEEDVVAAVDGAAQLWNDVDCGTLRLENVGRTPAEGQDADIELTWAQNWDINNGDPELNFTSAQISWGNLEGCMLPGKIIFNDDRFDWAVDGVVTDSSRDVFSDAANNFGRLLGLQTSDRPSQSIIVSTPTEAITELGPDDIDGFCALYDPSAGEDMGNVEPDMGSPPDMGSTDADMGPDMGDEELDMEVEGSKENDTDDSGCQTTSAKPASAMWLLLAFGVFVGVRRRDVPV